MTAKARIHIHQIIPAPPGTSIMVFVQHPDGTEGWSKEPVPMFALVEDYDDYGQLDGDRYVAPMRDRGMGCFTPTCFDGDVGDVLSPGEQLPMWTARGEQGRVYRQTPPGPR